MADNTVISAGAGGDTIADDEITDGGVANGAKVQRVKVGFGADGTYADVVTAAPLPVAQQGTATVSVSGTPNVAVTNSPAVTVASGTVTADTELPAPAVLADGAANPTVPAVAQYTMVWNGSTWDRRKSTTAATGTSGVGVPAAGVLGFDGTNYRRVATDTAGVVQTALAGPALSDLIGNPSSAGSVGAYGMVWNGSTWDRVANPVQVNGSSTGRGILAAGLMAANASGQWVQPLADSANGGLFVAPEWREQTQGINANGQSLNFTDCRPFSRLSFQLTGVWTGTFKVQACNDNATWVDCYVYNSSTQTPGTPFNTITANGLYYVPLASKYIRIVTTTWSSGTASVYAELLSSPGEPIVQADTEISAPAALADGAANPTTGMVGAADHVYNGATWDRLRSFGTTGAMGVTPTPGTTGGWNVTYFATLTSTGINVKSTPGTVGGYLAYNPNTSVVYLCGADNATGTAGFIWVMGIPAGSAANVEFTCGLHHTNGIVLSASSSPTTMTAPTTAIPVTLLYK